MAYNLYIDTDRGVPVIAGANFNDSSIAALPPFVQGDSLKLRIWLLSGFSRLDPYNKIPVSGVTLQVALGTRTGSVTAYYTQQFTWTPSDDLGQPFFAATLALNTTAVNTLLGSNSSGLAWFEVKMVQSGVPVTVLSKQVTVQASVIKDGGVVVPAPLTPLSVEAAASMFVKVVHRGTFDVMYDDTIGFRISCDADGAAHFDPIS